MGIEGNSGRKNRDRQHVEGLPFLILMPKYFDFQEQLIETTASH
jgi:hypothetical protein